MYRLSKIKNRKRKYEIVFPEDILKTNYKILEIQDIKRLLSRLILAEYRSTKARNFKKLVPYAIRLREKRLEVARYYLYKGGKVSSLALKSRLPNQLNWPGLIGLVESKGYESNFIA
jgi:hypothetical protein